MQGLPLAPHPLQVTSNSASVRQEASSGRCYECPRPPGGQDGANPSPLALSNHDPHGPRAHIPHLQDSHQWGGDMAPSRVLSDDRQAAGINYGHRKPQITLCAPRHYPHLPLDKCVWRAYETGGTPLPGHLQSAGWPFQKPSGDFCLPPPPFALRHYPSAHCHTAGAVLPFRGRERGGFPGGGGPWEHRPLRLRAHSKCSLYAPPQSDPPPSPPVFTLWPRAVRPYCKWRDGLRKEQGARKPGSASPPRRGSGASDYSA